MNEIWEDDGIRYNVSAHNRNQFLNDHPNATLIKSSQETVSKDQGSFTPQGFQQQGFGDSSRITQQEVVTPGTGTVRKTKKYRSYVDEIFPGFDQTWLGSSIAQATATGEAMDLFMEGSSVNEKTLRDFIDAEYDAALHYVESDAMKNFNRKYEAGGKTWSSFFGAVWDDMTILPELFTRSLGTQIGTLMDSEEAQVAFGTGVVAGYGGTAMWGDPRAKIANALFGGMAANTTIMETSLTFTELLKEELDDSPGKEWNEANIKALLEGPKGKSIRNKAIGRGLTIGSIEAITGLAAGRITTSVLRSGPGISRKILGVGAGLGVESIGGGVGEVAGRFVAGQEMDPAEIGFETITGLTTAPLTVGGALLRHKDATYKLNKEVVSYATMKDFIETATDMEIATANISMPNDQTGLAAIAHEKQTNAIFDSQIDAKITDVEDRKTLVELQKELIEAKADVKKEGNSQVPGAKIRLDIVNAKIDAVINKYKGAVGFDKKGWGRTALAKQTAKTIRENRLSDTIEFAETQGKLIDKTVKVVDNDKQAQAAADRLYKKMGKKSKNVKGADGFILGDTIIINKDVAGRTGAITVGSHEILHGIIGKHIDNLSTEKQMELGKSFINVLSKSQKNAVLTRLKNQYKLEGDAIYTRKGVQEMFTVFSDAIEKGEITFDEGVFDKIKNVIHDIIRVFTKGAFKKEFRDGRAAYNFLKEYNKNVKKDKLGRRAIALAKEGGAITEELKSLSPEAKAQVKEAVDEIGQTYSFEGGKQLWDKAGSDAAVKEIEREGYFNDLIAAKWKGEKVPKNFVKEVLTELSQHIKNFNPEVNNSLFGWINSQISNKANKVYNENYKQIEQEKTAKPIEEKTKEGEVKLQVAAEKDVRMKQLEEEDISPAAEAKKKADALKAKEKKYSKFRRKIGIETGTDLYNKVISTARKALLRAYEVGTSVRNIQRKLRDEASVYLFKDIKNFLGTKEYIKNLKEYRTFIVDAIFTADLVQMEAKIADKDRIFTKFKKKLTSKAEVEAAVEQNLLPKEALSVIDKGTAVNLYEKVMPTEKQFVAFFDQPAINPETGARSGLKGTRKDGLAKAMAGSLSFDAIMEVAQDPEVAQMRQDIAEMKGETLAADDIQQLASAIGREQDVLFSKNIIAGLTIEVANTIEALERGENPVIVTTNDKGEKEFSLKDPIKKQWTKTKQPFAKDDQSLVAKTAYNIHKQSKWGEITNYELYKKALTKVIKGRKKGKTVQLGIGFEQLVIDKVRKAIKATNSKLKSNKKSKEGIGEGDVYISYNRTKLGIEVKTHSARGVSQLMSFVIDENGGVDISFPNKNEVTNEAGIAFDDVIGKKILKSMKKLKADIKRARLGEIDGFKLTKVQADHINNVLGKYNYQVSIDVSPEYVGWHYANGKYSNKPQGLIQIGEKLYVMETGNSKVDALNSIVVHKYNESNPNNKIEKLELNENGKIELIAEVFRPELGKLQFRMSPRIDDTNFKDSKANLLNDKIVNSFIKSSEKVLISVSNNENATNITETILESRSTNKSTKGISILDFDDTLATTKSKITFTKPDGTTGTLTPEQYANTYEDLLGLNYKFDFSEFNKVIDGKPAPLLNKAKKLAKKFGTDSMFILTARPQESAVAIQAFLKANGLNIPLKNITGLGNSTAKAKASWVLEKTAEGYNDFYFADDAIQNVKAVKDVLNQVDVKSKVQQAKVLFSKSMNKEFNDILEQTTGVNSKKQYSSAAAKLKGKRTKYWSLIPASAQDFVGLLYNFIDEGKTGEKQFNFLKKSLIDPFARGYNDLNTARQNTYVEYQKLLKDFKGIKKKLRKKVYDTGFNADQAVRVYLWKKAGFDIPGISKKEANALDSYVKNNSEIKAFANSLEKMSKKKDGYTKPGKYWMIENIHSDLLSDGAIGDVRSKYLKEWQENVDVIFSEKNLNKIEAIYGSKFREALEDMLYRMKTGKNRPTGSNRLTNIYMNWVNNSVGAIMFFNIRSAVLQTISSINYINWTDNNPLKAGLAFANQTQFWKDFAFIFNSDMLKQRRTGNRRGVNETELSAAVIGSDNPVKAALSWLLSKGFLPTQIADSFAIASGGATFYRNRVNKYTKGGMSQKKAEKQAWLDFQETTEKAQQSARPDLISQQQANPLGRLILSFQNTPMQYGRIMNKAVRDLVNQRGDTKTHISKIIYYGAIQAIIFNALQSAVWATLGDEDEFDKKKKRMVNGMMDGWLSAFGYGGKAVSAIKNSITEYYKQKEKGWKADHMYTMLQLLSFSPPIGKKIRSVYSAIQTDLFNEGVSKRRGFTLDNPMWSIYGNLIEGVTNVPLGRLSNKMLNLDNAMDSSNEWWQRVALVLGWNTWDLGIKDPDIVEAKGKVKEEKKEKKKEEKKKEKKKTNNKGKPTFKKRTFKKRGF